MRPIQKLSPSHSQSSAGRSTLADDDSVTSATSYEMHRKRLQRPAKTRRSPRFIVAALGFLVFIAQFGASLSDVPTVRLLQEIICRRELGLAPDSPVQEGKCRTDLVQGQLNVISTGGLVFGYIPGKHCCWSLWPRLVKELVQTSECSRRQASWSHSLMVPSQTDEVASLC